MTDEEKLTRNKRLAGLYAEQFAQATLNDQGASLDPTEKLFHLLVWVGHAYEQALTAMQFTEEGVGQIGLRPTDTPRDVMMLGFLENLLQIEEEQG